MTVPQVCVLVTFAKRLLCHLKIMHKYACWSPKARLKWQLARPYDVFLSFFIKNCTNGRSTYSKFSLLPCYALMNGLDFEWYSQSLDVSLKMLNVYYILCLVYTVQPLDDFITYVNTQLSLWEEGLWKVPVQHKYSIQLAHARPTMHRIPLVYLCVT